ncbi:MAG: hypothetical protein JSS62_05065 [Verrucomicrobia bacterium]|nr:hypothetical protein [Verrucomicrobiota bacterium]MBS0647482.1 hypothetical protein [Verrucomicrobiota bacterium]
MATQALSILDALENLSAIVDAETLDDLELTEDYRLIFHDLEGNQEEQEEIWIGAGAQEQTLEAISKTFQAVAQHLEVFYRRMKERGDKQHLVESVNAVMVLVGEAAKKLERTDSIFQQHLSQMPAYHQLQEFYRSRIIKEFPQAFIKSASSSSKDQEISSKQTALNNLQTLKDDQLYELFYLKNEDGYNFFTPELAQHIKLACEFGEYAQTEAVDDPLLQIKNWDDRSRHLIAKEILQTVKRPLEEYFKYVSLIKDTELAPLLNRAIMALMLASHSRHLLRQFSAKTCAHYMQDFIVFLREVLHHREFQKLQIYPITSSQTGLKCLKDLVQDLVHALFYSHPHQEEVKQFIIQNISKGADHAHLSAFLQHAQTKMQNLLSAHPNGPVLKALDIVAEQEETRVFDPLLLGNWPEHGLTLHNSYQQIHVLRMGCPITQHIIHKAFVTEEFKEFLRGYKGVLLFVNLQDRTSWKEYARCEAIEKLGQQAEFSNNFIVVTLPIHTDFYQQRGIYAGLGQSEEFIKQFIQQIKDSTTGFYFPEVLRKPLLGPFLEKLVRSVHQHYFDQQDLLSIQQRLVFISIVFNALVIKAWEVTKATDLALSSKDGLDLTAALTLELCAFLHPHPDHTWMDTAVAQCFAPTLLYRERLPSNECLQRTQAVIRTMEEHPQSLAKLGVKTFNIRFEL